MKAKQSKAKPKSAGAEKIVEETAKKLIKLMGVKVDVSVMPEEDSVKVQLETDNPGILIGYHGETLASFQQILAMIVYRQTGEWVRVLVNVGDYRERRQETLERMALSAAQKAKFSGESQVLPSMSSAERRLVHLARSPNKSFSKLLHR